MCYCGIFSKVLWRPSLSNLRVYQDADDVTQSSLQTCYTPTGGIDLAARANLSCQDYACSLIADFYGSAIGSTSASYQESYAAVQ